MFCNECKFAWRARATDMRHPNVQPDDHCGEFRPRYGTDLHEGLSSPESRALCELKEYQCWRYPPIVEVTTDA